MTCRNDAFHPIYLRMLQTEVCGQHFEVGNKKEKMTQQKIRCFHTSWCSLLFLHYFYYLRKIILGKWNEEKQAGHVSKTLRILPGKDQGFLSYLYIRATFVTDSRVRSSQQKRYLKMIFLGLDSWEKQQPFHAQLVWICYRIFFPKINNQIFNIQDFWLFEKDPGRYQYFLSVFQKINNQIFHILKCALGCSRTFVSKKFGALLCRWVSAIPWKTYKTPLKIIGWKMYFPIEALLKYCWWKKSQTTTWDVYINIGINYLSTGAGFLPSTVFPC